MSPKRRQAKSSIPVRGGVLPRHRLFAVLDRARGKAIWICGPPGAGKTTLVSSWVDARRSRCIWYRAQAGDGDLASFFYELGARAGRRRPALPHFTPEYRGSEAVFARRFFRELGRRLRPPWVLVADDLQEVASPEPLLAAVREGVEELPEGARVVLVSREEPPASFARLVANEVLSVVGGEQLRLTNAEALAIARAHAPSRGSRDPEGICARASGWAAGIVLLATGPAEGGPSDAAALFRYLASELLDRAEPEVRRILLDAAIPPTLPVRIVNALCASDRAAPLLDDFARRAYFVARRGGDQPIFELHPLARGFLLDRGRSARSPEELRSVTARAAALMAESGFVEQAIDLYVGAAAWEDAARLALALAPDLVATGRVGKLEACLDALPPALLEAEPWFSYWRGVCRLSSDPAAAHAHLARAWTGFDMRGDVTGLHLTFAAAINGFIIQWAELRGMDVWIDRYEAMAASRPSPSEPEVAQRSAAAMFTALTFRRVHSDALPVWEQRAFEIAQDGSVPAPVRLGLGSYILVECAFRGEGVRAAAVVRTLAPLARQRAIAPLAALNWLASEAVHWWHAGDPSRSDIAAALGLEMARESGVHVWDFLLRNQRILAALAAGDPARAREHMARTESSLHVPLPMQVMSLGELETLLALHEGDGARMLAAARATESVARETGMAFAEVLWTLYVALALVDAGGPGEARQQLGAARRAGVGARSALVQMIADLAEAELDRRSGDLASARVRLEAGFRICREKGIAPDLWFTRSRLAVLCALALAFGIETEHVLGLVRRLELEAPEGYRSDRWPWTVLARLLGPVEVLVRGARLRVSRAHQRPLDVLAALVASAGSGRREELAAALWPDSDGDLAQHALETAAYRLRRLLGQDVVRQRGGTLVLDRGRCWSDVAAFDAQVRSADACMERRRPEDALSAAQDAVALYRGPFLPGREEPWVLATRARLRTRLRRCLSDLERTGADREAVRRLRERAEAADAEMAQARP